jgi:nitrilase
MTRSLRVAAVQATPVFLDREATIEKAMQLVADAAADGAELVLLPESFVPTYPEWVWRTRPWDAHATELWTRMVDQAVVVGSPATDTLADCARAHGVHLSIGVTERDAHGASLYNTALLFGPDGRLVHRHRKLMPTGGERLVWGAGDGSSLHAVDTAVGRIGTLICWENLMPLARTALYQDGIDILLAPTWDSSPQWLATAQHTAREGRVFVITVASCLRTTDVGAAVPGRDELYGDSDDWMCRGNAAIVHPNGTFLAGPLVEAEGTLLADLDLGAVATARQQFDPTGHYARPDVLGLRDDRPPERELPDPDPRVVEEEVGLTVGPLVAVEG